MFRDELGAFRARYQAAVGQVEAAWGELQAQHTLVDTLREQLESRGMSAIDSPKLDPVPTFELDPESPSALDLAREAERAEQEAARLRELARSLGSLARLLNRRLSGEDVVEPLGVPPRPVPMLYRVAIGSAAVRLWILVVATLTLIGSPPAALAAIAIVVGLAVLGWAAVRAHRLARFLSICRDATFVHSEQDLAGSTEYSGWPLPFSDKWHVTLNAYSGQARETVVSFLTHDARRGELKVGGGSGYTGGVILYDPETLAAYDVKEFACRPVPDVHGRWVSRLAPITWVRVLITGALMSAFLVFASLSLASLL